MRNRVHTDLSNSPDSTGWSNESVSLARLVILFVVITVPMVAVVARLLQLQGGMQSAFAAEYDREFVDYEVIPARDGRILAGGKVLAIDVERYDILAHYRWFQHPSDKSWLKQTARETLPANDRYNTSALEQAEKEVLRKREHMWRRIAQMVKISPRTLSADLDRIQKRVERIAESVNQRAAQRRQGKSAADADADTRPLEAAPNWFQAIQLAVTTQPERHSSGRITVLEELDYHTIVRGASLDIASEIRARPERYPGLRVIVRRERKYPEGQFAAHVIGSRTKIQEKEIAARREKYGRENSGTVSSADPFVISSTDRIGRTGLERTYDRRLRGIAGRRKIVRNRRGEIVRTTIEREPTSGQDVHTTLLPDLQARAERLLDAALDQRHRAINRVDPVPTGGSLVAIDVHSGNILAAASAPRADLNVLSRGSKADWDAALADPRRPLFARATQMALPPGSVFKAISAIAVLESRRIDPDDPFECQGYLSRPDRHRCLIYRNNGRGHGAINLKSALAQSCNVYFFSAAQKVQTQEFLNWSQQFGLGRPTGVDLPFENSGNLPNVEEARRRRERIDTLGLVIGQGRVLTTPIQIARAMAAIANNGYLLTPRVVENDGPTMLSSTGPDARTLLAPRRRRIPDLDEYTLARVREGLNAVVQHPTGSGFRTVRLEDIKIAGKTGTAETGGPADHAWFAGYYPADKPEIAFVVVLENGGSGGRAAGPIARAFVGGR